MAYGADVLLVNSPHLPNIEAIADTSRGKRSAHVDLRTEKGRATLRELLATWKELPRLDRATDDALWRRFSTARTTYTRARKAHFARAFARVSSYSAAGSESATTAPPSCSITREPCTMAVRITTDRSIAPLASR